MKKAIIAIAIGLVLIAGIITFGQLFAVSYVSVEFVNNVICASEQEILEQANINTGTNIFVIDEDKIAKNIEKNYADSDIKVNNVIREFPNKVIIKVSERFPIYKINAEFQDQEGYVWVDRNFQRTKIYNKQIINNNLINVSGYEIKDTYVTDECYRLRDIANAFIDSGFAEESLTYLIKEIKFTTTQTIIYLKMSDTQFIINAIDYNNVYNVVKDLYTKYLQLDVKDRDGKTFLS